MITKVNVNIYYQGDVYYLQAEKGTTIEELLKQTDIPENIEVFIGSPCRPNKTLLPDKSKTLVDYNMWFLDNYLAELSVFDKPDNYIKSYYSNA
jgi:hypothetical protein